jgi:hypothetical protein
MVHKAQISTTAEVSSSRFNEQITIPSSQEALRGLGKI